MDDDRVEVRKLIGHDERLFRRPRLTRLHPFTQKARDGRRSALVWVYHEYRSVHRYGHAVLLPEIALSANVEDLVADNLWTTLSPVAKNWGKVCELHAVCERERWRARPVDLWKEGLDKSLGDSHNDRNYGLA